MTWKRFTQTQYRAAVTVTPIEPVQLPLCAKCGKPVEQLTEEPDPMRMAVRYTVHCHGETETVTIGYCDLVDGRIERAVAFREPRQLTP